MKNHKEILQEIREEIGSRFMDMPNLAYLEALKLEKQEITNLLLAKILEKLEKK